MKNTSQEKLSDLKFFKPISHCYYKLDYFVYTPKRVSIIKNDTKENNFRNKTVDELFRHQIGSGSFNRLSIMD